MVSGIEGPHGQYQPFTIVIRHQDYAPLLKLVHNPANKEKRFKWRYPQHVWSHVFDDAFRRDCQPQILKGCRLKFHDHRIIRDGSANFAFTRADCKRKGSVTCTMRYNFHIHQEPVGLQDVQVRVM